MWDSYRRLFLLLAMKIPMLINFSFPNYLCIHLQFVNFTKIMSERSAMEKKETAFALAALMEIPIQYRATQRLQFRE